MLIAYLLMMVGNSLKYKKGTISRSFSKGQFTHIPLEV